MLILASNCTLTRIWSTLRHKFPSENTTAFQKQLARLLNTMIESAADLAQKLTEFDTY